METTIMWEEQVEKAFLLLGRRESKNCLDNINVGENNTHQCYDESQHSTDEDCLLHGPRVWTHDFEERESVTGEMINDIRITELQL